MKGKILEWANERGILNPDFKLKQYTKLQEEANELLIAIVDNNKEEQADAIGDCYVVLTILAWQLGLDIDDCIKGAYNEIKNRKGVLSNGTFKKD